LLKSLPNLSFEEITSLTSACDYPHGKRVKTPNFPHFFAKNIFPDFPKSQFLEISSQKFFLRN